MSVWIGLKNGHQVAEYASQGEADYALDRRQVDSVAPLVQPGPTRQANHVAVTASGTVHYAADSATRPAHILACNGRAVDAMGDSHIERTPVTCAICLAGERSGRIVVTL
jgi:hypothetical protein